MSSPMFSLANRSKLVKGIRDEAIQFHPLLKKLEAKGRIKYNQNCNTVTRNIRLDYSNQQLSTWGRATPLNASEEDLLVQATYTTGALYSARFLSGYDKRLYKGDETRVFSVAEEAMKELTGNAMNQLYTLLRTGDGTTIGAGGGVQPVGLNSALPTTLGSGSYAGIAWSGNNNYKSQLLNGDGGSSTDWVLDSYERLSQIISLCTLRTNEGFEKPDIGFCSRANLVHLREVYFNRGTSSNPRSNEDSSATAELGSNGDYIVVDGVPIYQDDNVRSNTIEIWNTNSIEIWLADSDLWTMEEKPMHNIVGGARAVELSNIMCIQVTRPRLNGLIVNANV